MTSEEIARFFNRLMPHIQGNLNLFNPKVEGCFRIGTFSYEAS